MHRLSTVRFEFGSDVIHFWIVSLSFSYVIACIAIIKDKKMLKFESN